MFSKHFLDWPWATVYTAIRLLPAFESRYSSFLQNGAYAHEIATTSLFCTVSDILGPKHVTSFPKLKEVTYTVN